MSLSFTVKIILRKLEIGKGETVLKSRSYKRCLDAARWLGGADPRAVAAQWNRDACVRLLDAALGRGDP